MRDDLISLSELMKFPIRIDHYDKVNGNVHFVYGVESVLEYAEHLPRVEAKPVAHAHWENVYDELNIARGWRCSRCKGSVYQMTYEPYEHCPHCGAKMN